MQLRKQHILLVITAILVFLSPGCNPKTNTPQVYSATPASDTKTPEPIPTSTATSSPADGTADRADVIFYNGTVLTMEDGFPTAAAIAIGGERILAVGDDEVVLALADEDTRLVDLQGQTLMPGLADGHSHIFWVPEGMTLDEVQNLVLSYGYTSVSEMTSAESHLDRLLQAEADESLRLRVNVFVNYNDSLLDENGNMRVVQFWYPNNGPILDSDRKLRIPGIKIFVDGAGTPGRGCPAMREPYPAEVIAEEWFWQICLNEYGDLYWSLDELNQVVADAQAAGYRVAFHAMGDRAIETALDAIDFALDGQSNSLIRHQIQHSSTLASDLMARYVDEGILSSVRGHFNTCDQDEYRNHAAANRYSLPGLGVHAYLETDAGWRGDPEDVTQSRTLNPMVQLYGLVTHKQLLADGMSCAPDEWIAQHVITIDQALYMMTYEPIYAVSQEDVLGSLTPGKYADLVILSTDPHDVDPDHLKDIEVWMTMVGGEVQYCQPGHENICPGWLSSGPKPTDPEDDSLETTIEPVTLKLFKNEHRVPAGTPIQLTLGWVSDTEAQTVIFFDSVSLSGTLDGQPLTDLGDYWGEIEIFESSYGQGNEDYLSNWIYPLGVLSPGTHLVEITGVAASPITDGFDMDGDGVLDEYDGEFWQFSVQIIVEE